MILVLELFIFSPFLFMLFTIRRSKESILTKNMKKLSPYSFSKPNNFEYSTLYLVLCKEKKGRLLEERDHEHAQDHKNNSDKALLKSFLFKKKNTEERCHDDAGPLYRDQIGH